MHNRLWSLPVCPVEAIFADADLPEKWRQYVESNAGYVDAGQFQAERYKKEA